MQKKQDGLTSSVNLEFKDGQADAIHQLMFLDYIQKLLDGILVKATASYQFALVLALVRICVRSFASADSRSFLISRANLAEEILRIYWQQTNVISLNGVACVLQQINGKNRKSTILENILDFRMRHSASLDKSRQIFASDYQKLVKSVGDGIFKDAVLRLQGQGPFLLYPEVKGSSKSIELMPGVAFCFARFAPLIQEFTQAKWISYIRRRNQEILSDDAELEVFLFSTKRQNLVNFGREMRCFQDVCFYCGQALRKNRGFDVDHFIPFSLYPNDLAHNFVLADPSCNRSKSACLPAHMFVCRWADFVQKRRFDVDEIADRLSIPFDVNAAVDVAIAAYARLLSSGCSEGWIPNSEGNSPGYVNPDTLSVLTDLKHSL